MNKKIHTALTEMLSIDYPIIGAPMFLVSNIEMVVAISEAGGIGTFPALNFRPIEEYKKALMEIRKKTKKPIGVNIIVNKSNRRQNEDLKFALDQGVNLFITSLGNPKDIIQQAHHYGAKVFCDVTQLEHAKKVEDLGADAVIAVGSGAGGHAGPLSNFVLIPWLCENLKIPVIAAGGVATGKGLAAAIALGACGASLGTRFIASKEARVDGSYQEAILKSTPEDIVMTTRLSGTPASVIRSKYLDKIGYDLPWHLRLLKENKWTKDYVVPLIHWAGMKNLEKSIKGESFKNVWSAGQTVGLISEIKSCEEIIHEIVQQYEMQIAELHQTLR